MTTVLVRDLFSTSSGENPDLACLLAGYWCLWLCRLTRRRRASARRIHCSRVRAHSLVLYSLLPGAHLVISAVRSHNVARVNKSHESFGDRFSTVVIDDLVTSDLVAAVKGMLREFASYLMAEHIFQESTLLSTSRPHLPTLLRQTWSWMSVETLIFIFIWPPGLIEYFL